MRPIPNAWLGVRDRSDDPAASENRIPRRITEVMVQVTRLSAGGNPIVQAVEHMRINRKGLARGRAVDPAKRRIVGSRRTWFRIQLQKPRASYDVEAGDMVDDIVEIFVARTVPPESSAGINVVFIFKSEFRCIGIDIQILKPNPTRNTPPAALRIVVADRAPLIIWKGRGNVGAPETVVVYPRRNVQWTAVWTGVSCPKVVRRRNGISPVRIVRIRPMPRAPIGLVIENYGIQVMNFSLRRIRQVHLIIGKACGSNYFMIGHDKNPGVSFASSRNY